MQINTDKPIWKNHKIRKTIEAGAKKMYFKSGFRKRKAHLRELEKLVRVEVRESGEGEWERCESVCDYLILNQPFMKSSLRDSVSKRLPHG